MLGGVITGEDSELQPVAYGLGPIAEPPRFDVEVRARSNSVDQISSHLIFSIWNPLEPRCLLFFWTAIIYPDFSVPASMTGRMLELLSYSNSDAEMGRHMYRPLRDNKCKIGAEAHR